MCSVSVDSTGIITTDLFTKPTYTHQYLLATRCHPNHTTNEVYVIAKPSVSYVFV